MLLSSLLPLFACGFLLSAYSQSHPVGRASIPLKTRNWNALTDEQRRNWFLWQKHNILTKYKATTGNHKRASTGSIQLTDLNIDFTYLGAIQVGTPSKSYNTILDTGSSDLWLASSQCLSGCEDVQNPYDPGQSTSFKDTGNSIHIEYGSGDVTGDIGTDTVSFAGFSVKQQAFGVMTLLSSGIIHAGANLSGLMGLGFTRLAQTKVDPPWLTMAKNNQWSQPLFSFYLKRYSDDVNAQTTETNGGSMDIGFADNNKYTGSISYVPLSSQTYWAIPFDGAAVNGKTTAVTGNAAIDTGTSLIGGPSDQVADFYSHIQGAEPGTGENEGYWTYPCTTTVNVTLTFGKVPYSIDPDDFTRAVDNTGQTCMGAIFQVNTGPGSPVNWIVGDAFLKNVYTVFRQNPAAVGFAIAKQNGGGSSSTGRPTQTAPLPTNTGTTGGTGTTGPSPTNSDKFTFSLPFPTHIGGGSTSAYSVNHGLLSAVGSLMCIVTGIMMLL